MGRCARVTSFSETCFNWQLAKTKNRIGKNNLIDNLGRFTKFSQRCFIKMKKRNLLNQLQNQPKEKIDSQNLDQRCLDCKIPQEN